MPQQRQNITTIGEIAEVRVGFNPRNRAGFSAQASQDKRYAFAVYDGDNPDYDGILREGDIVIKSRGINFAATTFQPPDARRQFVTRPTELLIRLKPHVSYKPKYVAAFLNSRRVQAQLRGMTEGLVPMIRPDNIRNIQIPAAAKSKQRKIIKLVENLQAQRLMLDKKRQLIENIESEVVDKLINERSF